MSFLLPFDFIDVFDGCFCCSEDWIPSYSSDCLRTIELFSCIMRPHASNYTKPDLRQSCTIKLSLTFFMFFLHFLSCCSENRENESIELYWAALILHCRLLISHEVIFICLGIDWHPTGCPMTTMGDNIWILILLNTMRNKSTQFYLFRKNYELSGQNFHRLFSIFLNSIDRWFLIVTLIQNLK